MRWLVEALPRVLAIVGLVLAATWLWRAVRVYRAESLELTAPIPTPAMPSDRRGLEGLRDVSWTLTDGSTQHAWYVPSRNGALVIYVHGSPGARDSLLPEARALGERGYGALLLDLPSFGASDGPRRWDAPFRESVRAAVDFASAEPGVDPRRIAGFGYSMGTCIVAQVAAEDARLRALVLLAPFTRLDRQLRHQFRTRIPGIAEVAVLAARWRDVDVTALDTERAVASLAIPILVVAGGEDSAIPTSMPTRLGEVARDAEVWIAPGVGHVGFANTLGAPYFARLEAFFARALPAPAAGGGSTP